jgi:hypothetical protein
MDSHVAGTHPGVTEASSDCRCLILSSSDVASEARTRFCEREMRLMGGVRLSGLLSWEAGS